MDDIDLNNIQGMKVSWMTYSEVIPYFSAFADCAPDTLIAPREEPELVPFDLMLLGIHMREVRSLGAQDLIDKGGRGIPDHLLVGLILFENDDDMVEVRRTDRFHVRPSGRSGTVP